MISTAVTCDTADRVFRAKFHEIPLDHGYAVFSALSREFPWIHDNLSLGVHPIAGHKVSPGRIRSCSESRLVLRGREADLTRFDRLDGMAIGLERDEIRLEHESTVGLAPASSLRSSIVLHGKHKELGPFRESLARVVGELWPSGRLAVGQRRVIRIKGRMIVGYAVVVTGLSDRDSILLQADGLGGRHRMGCGVMVPAKEER